MTKKVFVLAHAHARQRAAQAIQDAPDGYVVTISEPNRTGAENALLHALLGEIAASVEWAGQKRDIEEWKRLMTAAWCRATGQQVEMLPALDGHGVDIVYRKTSKLTKKECAELIDFVQCWMAEHGVMEAA